LASSGKIDARLFVCCGFVLIGISNFMLAEVTTLQADFWTFFVPLALSGVGLAQIFVPLTMSVLSSVEAREIPAASAMFNLARQLGGSVAIAVLVTILARANATHHTELGSSVALGRSPVSAYVARNGGEYAQTARGDLNRIVTAQAAVLSYADTARVVGAISLVLAPLAFLLKRPKRMGSIASAK